MKIEHSNKTLNIVNRGAVLSHKALLFGHTTKKDRPDQIGQFGEGLKLGVLALIRAGYNVSVFSGKEKWVPVIEKSKSFLEDVLVFYIQENKRYRGVKISIDMSLDKWNKMQEQFLFLKTYHNLKDQYSKVANEVLLEEQFKNKVFVKGIFVQEEENLMYGYNLNVEVNRDRSVVRNVNLQKATTSLWFGLINYGKTTEVERFYEILKNDYADIGKPNYEGIYNLNSEEKLIKLWEEDFGKLYPAVSIDEKISLENAGLLCVVVPKTFALIMRKVLGEPQELLSKLREKVLEIYNLENLTEMERENLDASKKYVSGTSLGKFMSLLELEIGRFPEVECARTEGILLDGKRIVLNRKILESKFATTKCLIHEFSHIVGPDGSRTHTNAIENAWEELFKSTVELQ